MPNIQLQKQKALPLHLILTMLPWLVSNAACQLSKGGSKNLNPPLIPPNLGQSGKLVKEWQKLLADPLLAQATEREARKRATEFLESVVYYQQTTFERDVIDPPAVLQCGAARLLDYGADDVNAPIVFLIPSLINRYYIFDLTRKLSLARFLRSQGIHVFILDWGMPSAFERSFNSAMYVTEIIVPMAEWIRKHTKGKIITAGYCMGGILALALASLRPDVTDGLALLATPWDFSIPEFPLSSWNEEQMKVLIEFIGTYEELPADIIHSFFHCIDPYAFQQCMRKFASMKTGHPFAEQFLAIQHWANDGVALTHNVAKECFFDWIQNNMLAFGKWKVGGKAINPEQLKIPCFIAVPQKDKIVPFNCALPLAQIYPNPTIIYPTSGHVGMIVGGQRKKLLWNPFLRWVQACGIR
jgi:polyhydroxyalkanoate synthase